MIVRLITQVYVRGCLIKTENTAIVGAQLPFILMLLIPAVVVLNYYPQYLLYLLLYGFLWMQVQQVQLTYNSSATVAQFMSRFVSYRTSNNLCFESFYPFDSSVLPATGAVVILSLARLRTNRTHQEHDDRVPRWKTIYFPSRQGCPSERQPRPSLVVTRFCGSPGTYYMALRECPLIRNSVLQGRNIRYPGGLCIVSATAAGCWTEGI